MENYLPVFERILYEKAEKNVGGEFTLPEYLPNISRVVRVSVIPAVRTKEILDDALSVEAKAVFCVVYVSDYRDTLKCAVFPCEFSHTFPSKGIKEAISDSGYADCTVISAEENASVLSPRKLSLSCRASVFAEAVSVKKNEVFDPEENESLKKLTSDTETLCISELPLGEIHIEENIVLENGMPTMQEIVFADCCLYVDSTEISDGVCKLFGRADFNCMYLAGENTEGEEYVSLSKTLPFSLSVEAGNIPENAYLLCRSHVTGISADIIQDSYGESKIITVSINADANTKAYYNEVSTICRDVFCTMHRCECEVRDIPYDCFAQSFSENMTVSESTHANLGNMTEIIASSADVSVISCELSEQRVVINAKASLKLMGTGELGTLESCSCSFGFKLPYSKIFDAKFEKCRFDTNIEVVSCSCRIENGEVKCNLELKCQSAALARKNVRAVMAVEIDDSTQFMRDKSEYIIYYPDSTDTVWSTAKKYKVSPAEIMAINGIKNAQEISSRKTLVIPR